MATILDGKKVSARIKEELKIEVEKLKADGIKPSLAVIIVGDDPASKIYVKNKKLSLFENDKGYLTVEDKQKFVKDVVNSIPYANNNNGEYGLVKLGSKSKGIDIGNNGELQILAATKTDISDNSTALLITFFIKINSRDISLK